ncbi:uncharacterized protein [Macrobrachium rosenbergii]
MNLASLLFPELDSTDDTRKVLEELDWEMEDATNENSSFISIEFPLRKNDSSKQQMLSIVDTGKGELDIGHPFVVKDPVRNIVYSIFPRSWKDETARQLACKEEGKKMSHSCKEFLENEKRCPKQSRVCVLDLGKSNGTLDECSSNSNCSAGHRCCFDRCANATMCKPESRIPKKRMSASLDDEERVTTTTSPGTDEIVDSAAPVAFQFENESTKFVLFPENWNDDEQCQKKCQGNNGTLECCLQDIKERERLCQTSSERLCILHLEEDVADRCENDENCPDGRKCCYDRCWEDTVCKKVRRKKDY